MGFETSENIFGEIPLKERDLFQVFLMKEMIGENPSSEDEVKWARQYAEPVSQIIDNPVNRGIRTLIMQGAYAEAALLFQAMLAINNKAQS